MLRLAVKALLIIIPLSSSHPHQGKETGRLEEEECQDAQKVRDFVAAGGRGGAK